MSESAKITDTHLGQPGADPYAAPETRNDPGTIGKLLSKLVDDVALLVRKELALATSEVNQSIDQAKTGVTSIVSGGAVLYAGVLFLLLAATLGLAEVMPGWTAALIVGGVVSLIGLIMVKTGSNKVQPKSFAPDRTARAVRQDADMIGRQTS